MRAGSRSTIRDARPCPSGSWRNRPEATQSSSRRLAILDWRPLDWRPLHWRPCGSPSSDPTEPTPRRAPRRRGTWWSTDDTKIWIDAGSGTFAALQAVCDPWDLDAVILTHEHSDHCLDVLGFHYALRYGERPLLGGPDLRAGFGSPTSVGLSRAVLSIP